MALGWASDDPAHRRRPLATIAKRYAAAGLDTRYYNPEIHLGAFALPTYMKELMR
jgi:spermidine synthase